jgi:ABC-type nitrate/sulfonate/bicarbonate transport system substrate-binding protein
MKRTLALACGAALALLLGGGEVPARALDQVKIVIPRDSIFVLNYNGAKDAGVFTKYGIDVDVDARPFAGFLAGLPSKECMISTYSGIDAIAKMNEGVDWVIIGGGLTVVNPIIVKKDAPYKTVPDLKGKTFGAFSTGAGSYQAARAAVMDGYGFDLDKDTKLQQIAPPALLKFLENGSVDAMLNISSFSIAAESQPDKYRILFDTNEYWRKKTGYPVVWAAPLVAWRSWVDQDPDRAKRFAEATMASFRWVADPANFDAAVKKYGELAGVTKPDEMATYKKLLAENLMFLTTWDKKSVAAEWQFLDVAQKFGVIKTVPDEATHALLVQP